MDKKIEQILIDKDKNVNIIEEINNKDNGLISPTKQNQKN